MSVCNTREDGQEYKFMADIREAVTKIYSNRSVDQSTEPKGGGGVTNLTKINRRKLLKILNEASR